jgi:NAD(P)-dependent dehydrogenase (short-subunit alcohol dehydrogenase family)
MLMTEEYGATALAMAGKVIAIPSVNARYDEAITELVLEQGGRLVLGASPAQYETLDEKIDGRDGVYCQPVCLDRPKSVSEFFQIAFAQFERLDVVLLEIAPSKRQRMTTEKAIELGTRRLLHCLDAAIPYIDRDLHFLCVAPASGAAAIPIATAFLATKFATTRVTAAPRVRMSIVSPPTDPSEDDVSFARTILHLIKEPRMPDIIEKVLSSGRKRRRTTAKLPVDAIAKMSLQP